MSTKGLYLFLLCALFITDKIKAQLRATNLSEYQFGNIPDVEPEDLNSFYNQLNVSYRYNNFSASTRLELFTSSLGNDQDYIKPNQFKVSYNSKYISLDAGHMYSTFGRGLLMRNYEIPASIFESKGYRVRHGFYKDMEGFSAKFKLEHLNIKVLRGRTLTVDLPPTITNSDRRTDLVEGAEIDATIKNQTIGLIFMHHENSGKDNNYVSAHYNGLFNNVAFYGELAKRVDSLSAINSFKTADTWGGYAGLNYTWANYGVSLEYKNYNKFLIGNGVNEPPTLVKEHPWSVLNRSTHVPLIDNEKGFQIELFYSFNNGNQMVLNHAQSKNHISGRTFTYREYHTEYSATINDKKQIRWFANYSKAPLLNETERFAIGQLLDLEHKKQFSSSITLEYQHIKRDDGFSTSSVNNGVASYTLSRSNQYSASLLLEATNDQYLLSDNENWLFYPSVTFGYSFSRKYKLSAFIGQRRGGPACSSGVCYEVLDFKGAELRFTSRFL